MLSGILVRAILVASATAGGREAARKVMASFYTQREEFEFEDHCAGLNIDANPNEILACLESNSGVALSLAFRISALAGC